MGYGKKINAMAKDILLERRNSAYRKADKEKNLFFSKYPEAEEIERKLQSTSIIAAKAVVSGSNVKEELTKLKEENLTLQNRLEEIYAKAGITGKDLEPRFICNKCKDTGYKNGVMCECYKKLLRETAYNQLNSLSPLSLSTFESFDLSLYPEEAAKDSSVSPRRRMTNIFKFCKEYAENFSLDSPNLLMKGTTGLGKTHLSLAIAREVINKGFGVVYCSAPNILSKIEKEHFSRYNQDEESTEDLLTKCDLLILDDLGTEFSTQFTSATVYNILNTRIMTNKPVIINTNMDISELEKNYTQRFVSRTIGSSIKLDFVGNDIRQIKAMK